MSEAKQTAKLALEAWKIKKQWMSAFWTLPMFRLWQIIS